MAGLIAILTFMLLMNSSACTFLGTPNFSSLKKGVNSVPGWVPSNNQAVLVRENKGQYVKFGLRIPNRPVNRKYSLAFTIEPAKVDSVLRKGKVVVSTKTRAEVRIILDIPGRIEDKKGEVISLGFAKKSRAAGGRSTFQTIGRGDLPVKAKLIIKDLSSNVLDAMQLEALGEGKEDTEGSIKGETSVEKQSGIGTSRFSTEPALLELTVSTGGFLNSVITILNEQDQPLHIKGYLQYIAVKSFLSSFSSEESKGYFPDLVVIEPSELDLQPGEKRKVNVICQVPQWEEERYYARVVLELDFPHEKEAGVNIERGGPEELSAASQKFKEIGANLDKPLEFMVNFKRLGKVKLSSNRKITAKDYQTMVEEITLEGQIEFIFPEGIRDLKAAYDKRLPPGKYLAEVSFKHGDRMLISQSLTFRVE